MKKKIQTKVAKLQMEKGGRAREGLNINAGNATKGNNADCVAVKCITHLSHICKWNFWVLLGSKRPCGYNTQSEEPISVSTHFFYRSQITESSPLRCGWREATVQPWDRLINRGVKAEEIA